ncbi:MAG: hypothetical protein CMH91_08990 [Oceanicaulis sp.]|jgi:Flp pilus assembly protein TadB|uniref:hypothetical protein n=1 Tax=unclassified Oceanicaulis TaxID=2632123 RepID=UPI000066D3AC|nr:MULTISPECIES: hypothetical protein [unclassified Oceanicaulis]EAP91200.1 hypothetical protein OA2633_03461 [Oceanicaulis sp. HTCC2633]MAB70198.1 hypothetical protein [Oceanicaulis sp.]MBC39181.1 hypothetical protein [Oceanicaulis sp.]MBG37243.1 hypothetical protein [Oceanicaulis sp.]HBU62826.1 hypothetical protein [Oceanicaulis sp.]|tara:strand:- start:304 stop:507 length:204 start_codon:yes stop_codon:yes gene_type:complete
MSETPARPALTPKTILLWALPVLAGILVLILSYALHWEPWFGFASIIAGALLTVMLIGNHYKVGPDA